MKSIKLRVIIIAIVAICTTNSLVAQSGINSYDYHETRLNVGFFPLYTRISHYRCDPWYGTDVQYDGRIISTPSLNFSYSYQFKKWLAFGTSISYAGVYHNEYSVANNRLLTESRNHYFAITPTVRFDWYRSEVVKLYSSIGLGLSFNYQGERDVVSVTNSNYLELLPSFDLTFVGITIGRKVFGLCELGVGSNGFIKVGVGYRFNDKK